MEEDHIKNDIKIAIIGNTAVGKTTIGELINQKLSQQGFNVIIINEDGDHDIIKKHLPEAIEAVKEKINVIKIVEYHANDL